MDMILETVGIGYGLALIGVGVFLWRLPLSGLSSEAEEARRQLQEAREEWGRQMQLATSQPKIRKETEQ